MPIRLSHSSKEMYQTCSYKWKLHYQEKLRSTKVGSALFFGNALDDAFNRLLLDKKKLLTDEEKRLMDQDAKAIFKESFSKIRVNGELLEVSTSDQAEYFKSDMDVELLEAADYLKIADFAETVDILLPTSGHVKDFVVEVQQLMKKGIDNDTTRTYNYICWLSLYRKGLMLIDTYAANIIPEIEEVFEVQKKICIEDEGDTFIGYIDLICSFNNEPGVKYVCDNKTSSKAYAEDSVRTSEQLAAYAEAEGTDKCAYIVVEKKLRKREPRTRYAIIRDTIPEKLVDATFDKLTDTFHGIDNGEFDKDLDACFQYGRKCSYYDHCRTGELKDLVYIPSKEKKNATKD